MTSATERLRALLDERGVEHFDATECTLWGYEQTSDSTGCYRCAADEVGEGFMTLRMHHITPEQAIAATLGTGTCHIEQTGHVKVAGVDYYDDDYECSECGAEMFEGYNYCTNCGRRVV